MKKENLLSSWKEIASYLDRDISTCRRWEKTHALPVYRIDEKSKSSVFAYKDEIDKWLEERLKKESHQKKFAFGANLRKSLYFIVPTTAVLLILLFIVLPYDTQPADFKIQNSNLIILNKKGKELWRYETGIENLVDENSYREHFQIKRPRVDMPREENKPYLIIKDINQDGKAEVLFSLQTHNELREGKLICFNHKKTKLWDFDGGEELRFGPKVYSSDYRITGFDTFDLNNDGSLEIMVLFDQLDYFPTQLAILNNKGEQIGEYWNSGRIKNYAFEDLNNDGRKELLLSAMNNEYKKGSLIVFDSTHVIGCSPQIDDFFKCKNLDKGSEKFYILFPRTDVGLLNNKLYEAMLDVNILDNRRISTLSNICRISFEFNYNLELLDVRLSHTFERLHNKLFLEGKIKSELDKEKYRKELANGLLYYDGSKWVNHYVMSNPWNSPEK